MNDPISIVRKRWFDATPPGREGVTERYVVFGESRKWLVEQLHLRKNGPILDFGAGHGFLSFELASRTRSLVTAMDVLRGGVASLSNVLRELFRVLEHGGVILLGDSMFP